MADIARLEELIERIDDEQHVLQSVDLERLVHHRIHVERPPIAIRRPGRRRPQRDAGRDAFGHRHQVQRTGQGQDGAHDLCGAEFKGLPNPTGDAMHPAALRA